MIRKFNFDGEKLVEIRLELAKASQIDKFHHLVFVYFFIHLKVTLAFPVGGGFRLPPHFSSSSKFPGFSRSHF